MRTVVIGAGVIGASVAASLAGRGAGVILVDRAAPGSGTSSTSYAWVNANGKEPEAYFRLNLAGLEAHVRLSPRGDAGWLGQGGHVEIAVDDHHRDDLAARVRRLSALGYGCEAIAAAGARALLPDVDIPEGAQLIVHYPHERYAYPMQYIAHVLGQARAAGARLRIGAAAVGLRPAGDGAEVALADGTVLPADAVVCAAGRWTAQVAGLAGASVPVRSFAEPGDVVVGYLAITNPLPVRLTRLVTSAWLNVRPAGGGRLMLQALDLDATADPGNVPGCASDLAGTFVGRLRGLVRNAEGAEIERLVVGERVMPEDGRTIVGRVPEQPWLYVVATHSGVTLAPFLGEAVAAELLGELQPAFADFRIERFRRGRAHDRPSTPRAPGQQ